MRGAVGFLAIALVLVGEGDADACSHPCGTFMVLAAPVDDEVDVPLNTHVVVQALGRIEGPLVLEVFDPAGNAIPGTLTETFWTPALSSTLRFVPDAPLAADTLYRVHDPQTQLDVGTFRTGSTMDTTPPTATATGSVLEVTDALTCGIDSVPQCCYREHQIVNVAWDPGATDDDVIWDVVRADDPTQLLVGALQTAETRPVGWILCDDVNLSTCGTDAIGFFLPQGDVRVAVQAVDRAGNRGPVVEVDVAGICPTTPLPTAADEGCACSAGGRGAGAGSALLGVLGFLALRFVRRPQRRQPRRDGVGELGEDAAGEVAGRHR